MSSPIMMLWLDLRVRTSISARLPAVHRSARRATNRESPQPRIDAERYPLRPGRASHFHGARRGRYALVCPPRWHADRFARTQPDPRLGPSGPHRRLDRPPARGDRPADRGVQARERARAPTRRADGAGDFDDEIDLRAEDDALIAAELEAARAEARRPSRRGRARAVRRGRVRRRRGRRRGRRRSRRAPRSPRRSRPRAAHRPARGHVRPRRGGLRPVARPRRPGQPRLRRALGRPPPGRGHDRRGPDRDQARSSPTTQQ